MLYNSKLDEINLGEDEYYLSSVKKILIFAIGEDATKDILEAKSQFKKRAGLYVSIGQTETTAKGVLFIPATLNYPTASNFIATEKLIELTKGTTEQDLIILIFSKGSQNIICFPHDRNLETKNKIVESLTKQGASPREINIVKKHLSLVKGGGLTRALFPAHLIAIHSPLAGSEDFTMKDATTIQDATQILHRYGTLKHTNIPRLELIETPKNEEYFEKVINVSRQ